MTRREAPNGKHRESTDDFWDRLAADFEECDSILSGFVLPSEKEKRKFQVSKLSKGKIKDTLILKINYGDRVYSLPQKKAEAVWLNLYLFGYSAPKEFTKKLPTTISAQRRDVRTEILSRIRARTLDKTLLEDWGALKQATGFILSLIDDDSAAKAHFTKNVAGNKPQLIEKYAYAYWMKRYWLDKASEGATKDEAETLLIKRIQGILTQKDTSIAQKKFLKKMLDRDKTSLLKTYSLLSKSAILDLLEDHAISEKSFSFLIDNQT